MLHIYVQRFCTWKYVFNTHHINQKVKFRDEIQQSLSITIIINYFLLSNQQPQQTVLKLLIVSIWLIHCVLQSKGTPSIIWSSSFSQFIQQAVSSCSSVGWMLGYFITAFSVVMILEKASKKLATCCTAQDWTIAVFSLCILQAESMAAGRISQILAFWPLILLTMLQT